MINWLKVFHSTSGHKTISNGGRDHDIHTPIVVAEVLLNKLTKQGSYSLRRPPKLIIPQIFIEQRWATIYHWVNKGLFGALKSL